MNARRSGAWLYWIGGLVATAGLLTTVLSPLFARLAFEHSVDAAPVMSPSELGSPAKTLLTWLAVGMSVFTVGIVILFVGYRRMQRDPDEQLTEKPWRS